MLTAAPGQWTFNPTFAYQWRRNGVNISGATAVTYTVQSADDGGALTVVVSATNAAGTATAASSAVTGMPSGTQTNVGSNPVTARMTGLVNVSYNGLRVATVSGIIAKPSGAATNACNWGATPVNGQNIIQFPVGRGEIYDNDLGGLSLRLTNSPYSGAANILPTSYPVRVFNNRGCQGGGVIVDNWKGTGGTQYSPTTPAYDTSPTWIFGNS